MRQRLSKILMVLHIMYLPIISPYEQRNLHKGHTMSWRKFFVTEPQNRIRELQNSGWKEPQEFSCLTSSLRQGQLGDQGFFHPHSENLHGWRKVSIPLPGIHNGTEGSITFPRSLMVFLRHSSFKCPGKVQHLNHYSQNLIIEADFNIICNKTQIKIQHKIKVNIKMLAHS